MRSGHVRRRCPKSAEARCPTRCGHKYEWRFSHDGRVFTGSANTEKAAHTAMRVAMAKAADGTLTTTREQRQAAVAADEARAAQVRLGDYLESWLSRRSVRESTRTGYDVIIRVHVKPNIGDVPVADLTTRSVGDLLELLATPSDDRTPLSRASLSRVRSMLSGAMKAAVRDGLITSNPVTGVELPERAVNGASGRLQVFTTEQLADFLARADKADVGPVLRFIAATGVRRGEAIGLRWDSVDLDAARASIRRSYTVVGGTAHVTDPKTRKGHRTIPLDRETVALLKDLHKAQAADSLRYGPGRWNAEGYVFVRADGTPLRPDSLTHAVKRITTAMGVPDLHLHSLRHSYLTAGLAAGIDIKVMSDIAGHSTTTLTRDVYQHTPDELAAEAAELIAALRRGGSVAKSVASGPADA